jgi:soluble lytic murein transglycosylase-like protein
VNALADVRAIEIRIAQLAGEAAALAAREGVRGSGAAHRARGDGGREPGEEGRAFGARVANELEPLVRNAARTAGLPPALVEAVVSVESGFEPRARSVTGARGLMQIEPETANDYGGLANPDDPAQNVRVGTAYLRDLLARFGGDVRAALAAYNAGPAAVERYGGVPPYAETRAYVERVLATYRRLGGG